MKKTGFLFAAMLLLLSSCGGSDTTNLPTAEEIQKALNNMKGNYTGKADFYLINNGQAAETETVQNITWTADNIITVKNLPFAQLARGVAENETLKTALAAYTGTQTFPLNYVYCYSAASNNYAFSLEPSDVLITLEYGGRTHTVVVEFLHDSNYSYVRATDADERIQIVAYNMYVDNVATSFRPMGITLTSSKKTPLGFDLFE